MNLKNIKAKINTGIDNLNSNKNYNLGMNSNIASFKISEQEDFPQGVMNTYK